MVTTLISKLLYSWLFRDPSERQYTTQTTKLKKFVNRASTMLNNVFKLYSLFEVNSKARVECGSKTKSNICNIYICI